MTTRNLTHPKFQPPELNTKLVQIAEAIKLLSDAGALDLSGGGTGFSSYTLGDLLYGDANAALSKLAGNITTTRQFLRQTGTGTTSAAPAWDTVASTDLSDQAGWSPFTPTRGAATGTWTAGTVSRAKYQIIGKTMFVDLYVTGSTLSNITANLTVTVPGSKTAAAITNCVYAYSDNGTVGYGVAQVAGGTTITLYKDVLASTNFAASVTNTTIALLMEFEIG